MPTHESHPREDESHHLMRHATGQPGARKSVIAAAQPNATELEDKTYLPNQIAHRLGERQHDGSGQSTLTPAKAQARMRYSR